MCEGESVMKFLEGSHLTEVICRAEAEEKYGNLYLNKRFS